MIILVDGMYLLYRSQYTTGSLSVELDGKIVTTGAMYGFIRTLRTFYDRYRDHNNVNFLVCWDGGVPSIRTENCTEYKAGRNVDPDVREAMRDQCLRIRNELQIPQWIISGYEADDLIASYCLSTSHSTEEICIISNDKDIWSVLRPGVFIQKNTESEKFTLETLANEYKGATPELWPLIKAIGGDKSDNIPQMKAKVGLKTAANLVMSGEIKYLFEENPELRNIVETNLKVITLINNLTGWPNPGPINTESWNAFCDKYQMVTAMITTAPANLKTVETEGYEFPGQDVINRMMGT